MGEIKFRCWDKSRKEWVDDNLFFVSSDGRAFELDYELPEYHPEKWELSQYTGLNDKNGVEIYDGDVALHRKPGDKYRTMGAVSIESTRGVVIGGWPVGFDIKIIGNIYENSELLCEKEL